MKKILFLLLLVANFTSAQSLSELFDAANTKYKEGKYLEAIEVYKSIEQKNVAPQNDITT